MRITSIHIEKWRCFRDLKITIDESSRGVFIVGENGTGKSSLLKLIAAVLGEIGLSVDEYHKHILREPHSVRLDFTVDPDIHAAVCSSSRNSEHANAWTDRLIRIEIARKTADAALELGTSRRYSDGKWYSTDVLQEVVRHIRTSNSVRTMLIDSERAFPPTKLSDEELGYAIRTTWDPEKCSWRDHMPMADSNTAYKHWISYMFGRLHEVAIKCLLSDPADRAGEKIEPFARFKTLTNILLPHLRFECVDTGNRRLVFSSLGNEITFDDLSSGEKEMVFLAGLVDMFQFDRGFLLFDEPELHLNVALLRSMFAQLSSLFPQSQFFVATHSIDAPRLLKEGTVVILTRDKEGFVTGESLPTQGAYTSLAQALGQPAFSLRNHRYVFVEGEAVSKEDERYKRLLRTDDETIFVPSTSCGSVIGRVHIFESLKSKFEYPMRTGGVVDLDHGDQIQATDPANLYRLRVHEIENIFLHPPSLAHILFGSDSTKNIETAISRIQSASDRHAGKWIHERVDAQLWRRNRKQFHAECAAIEPVFLQIKNLPLDKSLSCIDSIAPKNPTPKAYEILINSRDEYSRIRVQPELWIRCDGKDVWGDSVFSSTISLREAEEKLLLLWNDRPDLIPQQLKDLQEFVNSLE